MRAILESSLAAIAFFIEILRMFVKWIPALVGAAVFVVVFYLFRIGVSETYMFLAHEMSGKIRKWRKKRRKQKGGKKR